PRGLGPAVHVSAAAPLSYSWSGRSIDVRMLAFLLLLMLMLIGQAFGGERMSCEVQPVRGDGREWHYRTKVGGDPRICWYPGEQMKPRSELYWETVTTRPSVPPSEAVEPKDATVLEPHTDGNFVERWRALDGR